MKMWGKSSGLLQKMSVNKALIRGHDMIKLFKNELMKIFHILRLAKSAHYFSVSFLLDQDRH